MAENELSTIINHDFGYQIDIPSAWREPGPDVYNSPFEVTRYVRDGILDGIVNVFWDVPGESRRRAAETGDPEVFDLNRDCLVAEGVKDIDLSETQVGERLATRLDNAYPLGSIDHWASRSYFMEIRGSIVCLNMGSPDVEADRALYDRIADSFVVIESPASIVMAHDGQTPSDFVVDVLVDVIGYVPRRATQRAVRLNTQRELVVALVDEAVAPSVVEQVNERSRQSGYSLTCRMM